MSNVQQPANDDTIRVRQITHYQFTWVASSEAGEQGTHLLQLVLDQGATEEVLTLSPIDSLSLQFKFGVSAAAFYDVNHRTVSFNTTPVGAGLIAAAAAAG